MEEIEFDSGRQVASMRPGEFRRLVSQRLELRSFQPALRSGAGRCVEAGSAGAVFLGHHGSRGQGRNAA